MEFSRREERMMEIKRIGKISGGQDGAIYNGILFRFDHLGNGTATYLKDVQEDGETAPFATFALDKRELITPHSNAVFFGPEFFEEGDEFPLLYSEKQQPSRHQLRPWQKAYPKVSTTFENTFYKASKMKNRE